MNWRAIWAIYRYEMARTFRTLLQSLVAPVISTSLYFVVFGTAIGSRIEEVEGIPYGAFIVPGLIMLTVLMQSDLQRLLRHLLPEVRRHDLRAPVRADLLPRDRHRLRRRRRHQVVHHRPDHLPDRQLLRDPAGRRTRSAMLAFLALTCISFSLFGFIIGIWAKNFEQLQLVPLLIISPLVFLGGSFYSITMLPPVWQTVTLFNPVVYLVSGFRWSLLRHRRRRRRPLARRDPRLHARLPRHRLVDVPHRLPPAHLTVRLNDPSIPMHMRCAWVVHARCMAPARRPDPVPGPTEGSACLLSRPHHHRPRAGRGHHPRPCLTSGALILLGLIALYLVLKVTGVIEALAPDRDGVF